MDIYFLGTGAGMPSRERNVTSLVLTMYEERGTFWMFDCGEGTQQQVLRSPLKLSKLEKLFITHLHGDHIYGLPGLLTSRSYQGGTSPLFLYGPQGVKEFVDTALRMSAAHLDYELQIIEFTGEDGVVFEDEQASVEFAKLDHRLDCFGFRIVEKDTPGKLFSEKLIADGIRPGPLYARLKRGENITLEDGRTLSAANYVDAPKKGRIVTVLGDTRPCASARRLAVDADTVVHEATFGAELERTAHRYYHSTTKQAAALASDCGAGQLILTHFSSRYRLDEAAALIKEAREIHPNTVAAYDHACFPVLRRNER